MGVNKLQEQINQFINRLGKHKSILTKQQIKILRGQAISGNVIAAQKGLYKLLKRQV